MQEQESQNQPVPAAPSMSDAERREKLSQVVGKNVRTGWRLDSQTDFSASLSKGKRPNHILHLILTIITGGLWGIFVWLPLSIFKHEDHRYLQIDAQGNVSG